MKFYQPNQNLVADIIVAAIAFALIILGNKC